MLQRVVASGGPNALYKAEQAASLQGRVVAVV